MAVVKSQTDFARPPWRGEKVVPNAPPQGKPEASPCSSRRSKTLRPQQAVT